MTRRAVIVGGPLLVALYAGLVVVTLALLEPRAAVPGLSRSEIARGLDAVGSDLPALTWSLVAVGLAGIGLSLAVSAVGHLARLPSRTVAILQLGVLVLGAPVSFFAAFPLGMDVADAFGVSGGLRTPWLPVAFVTSGVSLLALLVLLAQLVLAVPMDDQPAAGASDPRRRRRR